MKYMYSNQSENVFVFEPIQKCLYVAFTTTSENETWTKRTSNSQRVCTYFQIRMLNMDWTYHECMCSLSATLKCCWEKKWEESWVGESWSKHIEYPSYQSICVWLLSVCITISFLCWICDSCYKKLISMSMRQLLSLSMILKKYTISRSDTKYVLYFSSFVVVESSRKQMQPE